jgi:acetyl esterase/lipase
VTADPRSVLDRPAPAPDATVRYGPHPDQVADLRAPAAPGPARPLVVVVHGGFWRHGYDRTHTGPLAADLAARGWPVAQLEYRRTGRPGGTWSDTLHDVAAGIAAVPELAGAAGIAPPGPPLLLGHSAGGHLALWYAAEAPSSLRGVVALAPVADLAEAYRLDLDAGAVAALLGGGPEQVPDRYARADPSRRVPTGARTVILHGSADRQVPVEISRSYAARAAAAGDDVRLVELTDCEHFGLIDPMSPAWGVVLSTLGGLAGHDNC